MKLIVAERTQSSSKFGTRVACMEHPRPLNISITPISILSDEQVVADLTGSGHFKEHSALSEVRLQITTGVGGSLT